MPDKIILENCLLISKAKNNFWPSLFNNWFTFLSKTYQYKTSLSTKGLLQIPIINTKSYDKGLVKACKITSWNEDKSLSTFRPDHLKSFHLIIIKYKLYIYLRLTQGIFFVSVGIILLFLLRLLQHKSYFCNFSSNHILMIFS